MMPVKIFHSFWGMTGTLSEQMRRAKQNGFDGVELPAPSREQESEFKELLEELDLAYIAQISTYGDHASTFQLAVERASELSPLFINSHSGKDSMTEDEQNLFFEQAVQIEREAGLTVAHETHRGRVMYSPWSTARVLRLFPELKVTADFSHFTNVCESMLDDQKDALALIQSRAIHVHGRIGYEQGPQIPHPAAPEYASYVQRFEQWWDGIFNNELLSGTGARQRTLTPEFGPPGYMPVLPFTKQPVADLLEVNLWIADRIRDKYNR